MSGFREYGGTAQQILDEGIDTSSSGAVTPASIGADTPEDRDAAISALIAGAPGALDTLNELAAALGDDQNYAATVATALAGKQPLDADLTAIAALTTTATGRSLLAAADAAAIRAIAGAEASGAAAAAQAASQPLDGDLTAIAALVTTSFGRGLLALADAAALAANHAHASILFKGCSASRTTDQTGVVTGTDTVVVWNGADDFDTDGYHDPASNASQIIIPAGRGGKYEVISGVVWDATAAGNRHIWIRKNGTTPVSNIVRAAGTSSYLSQVITALVDLAAGDYVETIVNQDSGGNRTLSYGTLFNGRFSARLVGV